MKKLLIILVTFGVAFSSCIFKDEMGGPVIGDMMAPALNDISGTYIFTEEQADEVFQTFTWTDAEYGFQSANEYTLQIDFAGGEFATPIDLLTTDETSASITIGELNQKLLSMGGKTNVPSDYEFRVVSNVSDYVETLASNAAAASIQAFKMEINYPSLYMPGSYQAASGYTSDWSPDKAQQIYSLKQNEKYEGYVNMVGSDIKFKFTDGPNWDTDWGDDGADGTLEPTGADIAVAEPGYYRIKADISNLTYEMLKTTWGLIGSATPGAWDNDMDMTYDMDSKTWSVTLDLIPGEIKFRANKAWDLDYGDDDFNGSIEQGGNNIPVEEAGNYTVTLNLEVAGYAYSVVKN